MSRPTKKIHADLIPFLTKIYRLFFWNAWNKTRIIHRIFLITIKWLTVLPPQSLIIKRKKEQCNGIELVIGPNNFSSESECAKGFLKAFNNTKMLVKRDILHVHLIEHYAINDLMSAFSNSKNLPDYFIVSNEEIAKSLLDVLKFYGVQKNLRVGRKRMVQIFNGR